MKDEYSKKMGALPAENIVLRLLPNAMQNILLLCSPFIAVGQGLLSNTDCIFHNNSLLSSPPFRQINGNTLNHSLYERHIFGMSKGLTPDVPRLVFHL